MDLLRGVAVIAMIVYHTLWDLVYVHGVEIGNWADRPLGRVIFQSSIRWSFVLLSGFCFQMGKKHLKRGLTVFGGGVIVTLVTMVVMGGYAIHLGVLTFLGSAMLLTIPLDKLFRKISGWVGFPVCLLLFLVLSDLSGGFVGLGAWRFALPFEWYANYFTAWLGMPSWTFYSADYVPMLPWIFAFWMGYFTYNIFKKHNWLPALGCVRFKPLEWIGRNALLIYMVHQPIVYGALYLILI